MKKILFLITCIIATWAMSSCDKFGSDSQQEDYSKDVQTIQELSDTVKQKIVEQDSLMSELVNKVDSLTLAQNAIKAENEELKEKIAELKSPKSMWGYMTLLSMLLAIAAIVYTFLKPRGVKRNQVGEIFRHCIEESSRIKELQVHVNNLLSTSRNARYSQSPSTVANSVDLEIALLKKQMAEVLSFMNSHKETIKTPGSALPYTDQEPVCQKNGYAKIDTDVYFTTIYDSNQEGCVFKISFTSKTKGEFEIISLDKIQSRNDWQRKVECSGVSIKDAVDYKVITKGVCEKIDDTTWKVISPLKIKLLK